MSTTENIRLIARSSLECIIISVEVEGKSHLYVVNLYRPPQMQMSTLKTSLCVKSYPAYQLIVKWFLLETSMLIPVVLIIYYM